MYFFIPFYCAELPRGIAFHTSRTYTCCSLSLMQAFKKTILFIFQVTKVLWVGSFLTSQTKCQCMPILFQCINLHRMAFFFILSFLFVTPSVGALGVSIDGDRIILINHPPDRFLLYVIKDLKASQLSEDVANTAPDIIHCIWYCTPQTA